MEDIHEIAKKMVASGKGILAADESVGSATKRLKAVGVESSEETRRQYRNLFLSADGIEEYLSGVILHEETLSQKADDGTSFPELLEKKGILPGIKVDKGTKDLEGFPEESVTEGLDGLAERLEGYKKMGAKFTKWRSVIRIGDGIPTQACLDANAFGLARYARIVQEAGMVPMVEPEVLLKGKHGIKRAYKETLRTLQTLFMCMKTYRVDPKGLILKTSMVVPGDESGEETDPAEVSKLTAKCLRKAVPGAVPGIVFLSGGQSALDATANLDAVVKRGPHPWQVTFSYARALQGPALEVWRGDDAKVEEARKTFLHRLKMNGLAREGEWSEELEKA